MKTLGFLAALTLVVLVNGFNQERAIQVNSKAQMLDTEFDMVDVMEFLFEEMMMESEPKSHPPYTNYSTPELIEAAGFPSEIHHVTTADGYILEMHRIPYGRNGPDPIGVGSRPVAFVQHCLLCSSADFVMGAPDRALAFMLADAGYDVWLNNFRGNVYSRHHETLDPDRREFWQFSWDEHAEFDIPAGIDYALEYTGESQVYYVGFSMGSTTFTALLAEDPDYINEKIIASALMGPAVYMEDMKGPMHRLANYSDQIDTIAGLLGFYEVLKGNETFDARVIVLCDEDSVTAPLCYDVLFNIFGGPDPEELDTHNLPVYVAHTPAGTSIHVINHYAQEVLTAKFQKYDYGRIGNNNHYGQDTPPLYNISHPSPPIGLFWGPNDWLATPENVVRMVEDMDNVVVNHRVEWDAWNHLDFIWGIHAKEYVYDHVLNFLSEY